ncbi:hypothetical protein HY629_02285 [Candidatus Uhrbacteria bacterium]|nr:hypothetical protein [Candidatus Uhrbacteria bacterium]
MTQTHTLDMTHVHFGTIPFNTPLMFTDGSAVYRRFARGYITHEKGFFIIAPSGAGKTHFLERQKERHWLDGDTLWEATNAHPHGLWWLEPLEAIDAIDQRSDIITAQAKRLGFWVVGASNNWLQPDAVVLPPWPTHARYIRLREKARYDGGATTDRLQGVLEHRQWMRQWVRKGVPLFTSVDAAAAALARRYAASRAVRRRRS